MKIKAFIFASFLMLGGLASCSHHTCPTYSKKDDVKQKIEKTTDNERV